MKNYNFLLNICLSLFFLLILIGTVNAQYWFQSGVTAGQAADYNNGANVYIQTIYNQTPSSGSSAFWVGEDLSNGAFLQTGYVIENASGIYPTSCFASNCKNYEFINAGDPEWFYEYFPPGVSNKLYMAVGPDGSAGLNNSFHSYGFYYSNNQWYFTFDHNIIGNVSIGSSNSGLSSPSAIGELAETYNNQSIIKPVIFSNLSVYKNNHLMPVSQGFSYIGYGASSLTNLNNPYGVEELDNRSNYFSVGSGLPHLPSDTELWSSSYTLRIISAYSNLTKSINYLPYSNALLYSPQYSYINNQTREIFSGWIGSGYGSYTGPYTSSYIVMGQNITEIATWNLQYLANITSQYGNVTGSGWYNSSTYATFSVPKKYVYINSTSRAVFEGWSNENKNQSFTEKVQQPMSLHPIWQLQFFVNATSQYGNVTGSGWYDSGSIANISIEPTIMNATPAKRYVFYDWSNGNSSNSLSIIVNNSISIKASYLPQYFIEFQGNNEYGNNINVSDFYINNISIGTSAYLYQNIPYNITGVYYKNTTIIVHKPISVSSPEIINMPLPIYNVFIKVHDLFGLSTSSNLDLRFWNDTYETFNVPENGTLAIYNIPLGYVNGTATSFIFPQRIISHNGSPINVSVLSFIDVIIIISAIIIIFLVYILFKTGKNSKNVHN
jgi:hypothetical protein